MRYEYQITRLPIFGKYSHKFYCLCMWGHINKSFVFNLAKVVLTQLHVIPTNAENYENA
jgi:hypothetical protein